MPSADIIKIYNEVILSKKYANLHAPLIMRICGEEYNKYKKDKDRIKAVKNKLHIIYGAFSGDECHKKARELLCRGDSPALKNMANLEIMRLHASTNERLDSLDEFYNFIFNITGNADSILDIGCGFNPFSIPCMNLPGLKKYYAYDIDCRTADLLNNYFDLLSLPKLADTIDIIADTPEASADIAFIFKLIPVLEIQSAGRGFKLLQEINAGYIAATYPVKSLCGKDKGMQANYAESFEKNIAGKFKIIGKKIIGNELVYIIKKQV
jgi:16S rRNA (guanine(1405)-N(7))-methyltransferase